MRHSDQIRSSIHKVRSLCVRSALRATAGRFRWALVHGVLLLMVGASWGQTVIRSNFDSDLDGWTAVGLAIDTSPSALSSTNLFLLSANSDMVYDSGGDTAANVVGNPGGFARLNDVSGGPQAFARAPAKFLGDLSAFYDDGAIYFQHRLFTPFPLAEQNWTNAGPFSIIFVSGDLNDLNAYACHSDTRGDFVHIPELGIWTFDDWVTVGAGVQEFALDPITDVDFGRFDPSLAGSTLSGLSEGSLQTRKTLAQVLTNVTDLLITFERVDGDPLFSELSGIDNVILIPANPIPEITSMTKVGGDVWEFDLTGTSGADHQFRASSSLEFNPGVLVENFTQGGPDDAGTIGGVNNSVISPDGYGAATVRMSLVNTNRLFIKAQRLP